MHSIGTHGSWAASLWGRVCGVATFRPHLLGKVSVNGVLDPVFRAKAIAARTAHASVRDQDRAASLDEIAEQWTHDGIVETGDKAKNELAAAAAFFGASVLPDDVLITDLAELEAANLGRRIETLPADIKRSVANGKLLPIAADEAFRSVMEPLADLAAPEARRTESCPIVMLPGVANTVRDCANQLGELMRKAGGYYVRGGRVVDVHWDEGSPVIRVISPDLAASHFERVADLRNAKMAQMICRNPTAKLLLAADELREQLPEIKTVTTSPVLVERDGDLVQISDYDEPSGILACGEPVPEIDLEEARARLAMLVNDYRFATPADRARGLYSIITPCLALSGLLKGRAPIDLSEADQSQAGKSYRAQTVAAVYNSEPFFVTPQSRGGVGSLDEKFSKGLIAGRPFVLLDNFKGRLDWAGLEAFITGTTYEARVPGGGNLTVDPRGFVVSLTSNAANLSQDLANRCSTVRIIKQPASYAFQSFPEGDLLDHVKANGSRYLAAVFAAIRAWHAAGKPLYPKAGHDFRRWARVGGWIVTELLGEAPLMAGHEEAKQRMTSPYLSWLRQLILSMVRREVVKPGQEFRAHDMLGASLADDSIETPGVGPDDDPGDDQVWENANRQIGRRLRDCFTGRDSLTVDQWRLVRREVTDEKVRQRKVYWIEAAPHEPPHENAVPRIVPHGTHVIGEEYPNDLCVSYTGRGEGSMGDDGGNAETRGGVSPHDLCEGDRYLLHNTPVSATCVAGTWRLTRTVPLDGAGLLGWRVEPDGRLVELLTTSDGAVRSGGVAALTLARLKAANP